MAEPRTRQTRRLDVLVVGAGPMGAHHAQAVNRIPELARLVGVVDPAASRAEEVAESTGTAAFQDLDRALETLRPDVVHVCAPPTLHGSIGLAAVMAGASVYLEKPFTPTVAEAQSLFRAADEHGVHVCAGHQLLQDPTTLRGLDLLPDLGEIQHVESYFAFRQRTEPDGSRPRTGVEQLLDILPHPAYLLERFLGGDAGEPMRIDGIVASSLGSANLLVSRGSSTGHLVATLKGRPVDSFVRVIGTRGTLHMDHVRSVTIPTMGRGSTPEKIVAPYLRATSLVLGSTRSLAGRLLTRRRSYPGLVENFTAFYRQIAEGSTPPVSRENILETVRICERVEAEIEAEELPGRRASADDEPARSRYLVTGGTGFLGRRVVEALIASGERPAVLSRRRPPTDERLDGASYIEGDLAGDFSLPAGTEVVIHCAAETSGGREAHERNSIGATRSLIEAMEREGVRKLVYVSSIAVIDPSAPAPLSEDAGLDPDPSVRGPYVWGKTEAERLVAEADSDGRIDARIFRPGPLMDWADPDPPGRLGKAVSNLLVAVGPGGGRMPTCDVQLAGELLAWMAQDFEEAPEVLHGLDPELPTRREVVSRLRRGNSQLRVVWLPRFVLVPLSLGLVAAQKLLRPRSTAVNVAKVFHVDRYDLTRIRRAIEAAETIDVERLGTA